MGKQLFYEDVPEGGDIPVLVKQPTSRQLVMWAGASTDFYQIHYDKDFALSKGLPGVIVHGQLVAGFLGQMLTDWVGDEGFVRNLSCSYKGMNFPGDTVTCRGKAVRKYVENEQGLVECNIWAENGKAEKTVTGRAVVALPLKG